jgi:hypothetical protein
MQLGASRQAADECRDGARRRYPNRTLLCSLTPATADGPAQLLAAGGFDVSVSGPVTPGRALLLKLRDPDGGERRTFLARVASADRCADGSWRVRCRFAGTACREAASCPALIARAAS